MPVWRNWQTRRIQNPVPSREYRFDPDHRYYIDLIIKQLVLIKRLELFLYLQLFQFEIIDHD